MRGLVSGMRRFLTTDWVVSNFMRPMLLSAVGLIVFLLASCSPQRLHTIPPVSFPHFDGQWITVAHILALAPMIGPELFVEVSPRQLLLEPYTIKCHGCTTFFEDSGTYLGPYGPNSPTPYTFSRYGAGSPLMPHILGPDDDAAAALDELLQHLVAGIEGGRWVPDPLWAHAANPSPYSHRVDTALLCRISVGLAYIVDGVARESRSPAGGVIELGVYHFPEDDETFTRHVFMMSNRTTEHLFVLEPDAAKALIASYHKVLVRVEALKKLKKRQD